MGSSNMIKFKWALSYTIGLQLCMETRKSIINQDDHTLTPNRLPMPASTFQLTASLDLCPTIHYAMVVEYW